MAVYSVGPAGPYRPRAPLFCLTVTAEAGVGRPSPGDRWSLLERGHSTGLSVGGAPLEQPRTDMVSFCWEHAGASAPDTSLDSGYDM